MTEPDDARQPLRGPGAGDDPEAELRLAESGVIRGDADVARERELAAASERVAVDGRDRRPRKPLHRGKQRRVDRREPFVPRAPAHLVDVRAGDERRVARTREDEHADLRPIGEIAQRGVTLVDGLEVQRVADGGAIERERRNSSRRC